MAKVTVDGVVKRQFFNLKGVEIAEQIKGQDNKTFERKFTLWLADPKELSLGSTITATGNLVAKIDKWVNQDGSPKLNNEGVQGQSIVLAVNDAVVTGGQVAAAQVYPADEMPF
jgi:hypothetical protein